MEKVLSEREKVQLESLLQVLHSVALVESSHDKWKWGLEVDGNYSVKSAYIGPC